jgi:hypothetical protein
MLKLIVWPLVLFALFVYVVGVCTYALGRALFELAAAAIDR